MSDLPPDLERLRTLEVYLRLQLTAVRRAIEKAEQQAVRPEPRRPPPRPQLPAGVSWWRLLPAQDGRPPVLHRNGCAGGEGLPALNRGQARDALNNSEFPASPCPRCRPDLPLLED